MELDDIKSAWQALDRRLERQHALGLRLFTEGRVTAAKARLGWFIAGKWLQLALALALTIFAATFWIAERGHAALMLSGIALHVYGVALAISGVMELLLAIRIRYATPVVTLQRYLAHLRAWRGCMMPWLGLSHWLLWVPATLIGFRVTTGVDLWAHAPRVVISFLVAGSVGLAATLWLIHASPARLRRRVRDYLDRTNAGCAILGAQGALDEIARFEQE
ncbi:MAG TPA: hypothetical protein VK698_38485 [Kofleriaceae bacterium]|jgi:serine/threonine-protein kinase|nr:hypothetical protein [Kofleriaceae bacterium]